jgi:hypothetical protein
MVRIGQAVNEPIAFQQYADQMKLGRKNFTDENNTSVIKP